MSDNTESLITDAESILLHELSML